MLAALSQANPDIASAALAAAMLQLLGTPVQDVSDELRTISESVIIEAKAQLGIGENDLAPESMEKVQSLLSDEVDRILLGSRDRERILDRLGQDGGLPLGVYEIRSSDSFRQSRETLSDAKHCIVHCDEFEHIFAKADPNEKQWSMFSKAMKDRRGHLKYYALVLSMREGRTLSVMSMWRVYPRIVGQPASLKPFDLLHAFLDYYGLPLALNGYPHPDKLVRDFEFASVADRPFISATTPSHNGHYTIDMIFSNSFGMTKVRYAFAVDQGKYKADLKRLIRSKI